ncbi:hypothetical protein D3C76_1559450 [compost metagenome]
MKTCNGFITPVYFDQFGTFTVSCFDNQSYKMCCRDWSVNHECLPRMDIDTDLYSQFSILLQIRFKSIHAIFSSNVIIIS